MRLDPAYSATSPKVLVIDDDKGLREIIRMTLVPRCEVQTAASVDEGLKIFEALLPDVVIIDYQMPIKNGIEGIKEIRRIDEEVPIILLTAYADLKMAREAMELGVSEYMTKPFNVTDLKQTVDQFTKKLSAAKAEARPADNPSTEKPRFEIVDAPTEEPARDGPGFNDAELPPSDEPLSGVALEGKSALDPQGPALGRLFLKENFLECVTPKGVAFRSNILRLNPRNIVCEIFNPNLDIQVGDILTDGKVDLGNQSFRIGKATVREIIDTSILLICEIGLDKAWYLLPQERETGNLIVDGETTGPESAAEDADAPPTDNEDGGDPDSAKKSSPEGPIEPLFKAVVTQFGNLLGEIEDAMRQFETRLSHTDTVKRAKMEQSLMQALSSSVVPAMNRLSDRFEEVAAGMPAGREELHRLFVRHHLNGHLPFAPAMPANSSRPVGCPGDYRLPDRIFEPAPAEGSLFDKTITSWLLSSPPGEAVGYRTHFLAETLLTETQRCQEAGRSPRIFSLARGTVHELEDYFSEVQLADELRLTMLGFNEASVTETREALARIRRIKQLPVKAEFPVKTVNRFLAEGNRMLQSESAPASDGRCLKPGYYDIIYCSSLFHHFSDRVCQRFMEIFYRMLAPGGLIVICDLTPRNPLRHLMNFVLDENLIHRTRQEMLALVPKDLPQEYYRITEVPNGVELFLYVLKPESLPVS